MENQKPKTNFEMEKLRKRLSKENIEEEIASAFMKGQSLGFWKGLLIGLKILLISIIFFLIVLK